MQAPSVPKLLIYGVGGYFASTYISYKYTQITKAQTELRDIKDQKTFLHSVHQKLAETYDETYKRREVSNKINRFRKYMLQIFAEGRVLELGVGTGKNFEHYKPTLIDEYIGVDWSDNMLIKAFEKVDDMKKNNTFGFDEGQFKLMTADAHDLPFNDNEFNTVVSTFFLESTYNLQQAFDEMKRVCKHQGKILIISRGASYIALYNQWLQFLAARDLTMYGRVEQLDFDAIIDRQKGIKIVHRERKNLGMTYIYYLEVDKELPIQEVQDQKQLVNQNESKQL